MFWRQLIWKGSQGLNIKAWSNEISSPILPNIGHLHIGNFAGIQTVVSWIQNLCNETWDTTWKNWAYTAFNQTLSARIGGFGECFGMSKKASKMTLHRVYCITTRTAAEKLPWHQDAVRIKEKVYILVWIMRRHTWEQMASESWCSGAEPGRCSRKMSPLKRAWPAPPSPCMVKKTAPSEVGGERGHEELYCGAESWKTELFCW